MKESLPPQPYSFNKVLVLVSLLGVSLLGGDSKPTYQPDEPERMMAALETRDYIAATISNDRFPS